MRRIFLFAFCLAFMALTATAAARADPPRRGFAPGRSFRELAISRWSVDEGLPVDTLTDILETRDGYLWIASYGGLFRFDGLQFTVFDKRTQPGLASNGFHRLAEGPDGSLWVGTQGGGLWRFRAGELLPLPEANRLRYTVRSIAIDEDGWLWFGTRDHGAYRYDGSGLSKLDHPLLSEATVRDILRDRHGALWFATEGNGLVRAEDGAYSVYSTDSGLVSDSVTALWEAPDGTLWIGTEKGLNKLQGEAVTAAGLEHIAVFHIYQDDYRRLWLTTEQGLYRGDRGAGDFELLESPPGEPVHSASAIAFGREGGVWLATFTDGLFHLQESKFKNYTRADGLTTRRVNAAYETPDGEILIGGDGGSIDVVTAAGVRPFELRQPLPDVRVRGFLRDRRGRLWIASYAGLLEVSTRGEVLHTAGRGLPTHQVRLVYEDRTGRLWIGTQNAGLVQWAEDGGPRRLDTASGLTSNFILSIEENRAGELLLGTYEGLNIVRVDGSISRYGADDGLPGGLVFSTFEDRDGAVWLSTNGGLGRLAGGRIRKLTTADGLPTDAIFDFREDAGGFAWMTSSVGVLRVAKSQLDAAMDGKRRALDVDLYDDRDGMASGACTGATRILQAADGRLWFPTLDGIAVIDPGEIPINTLEPPVAISRFAVDGEALEANREDGTRLEIGPDSKELVFEFAALSFLAPSKVEVRYRLEGFDDDWIDAGPERRVRYTSLPHGDYSFRVIAANNDGVWNRTGARLDVRVAPFFYQRPLFIGLAALVLGLVAGVLYRWRTRAVRARNLQLEELVAELEAKNAEMERFVYTVSHDLKAPLITIKGFIGMLLKDMREGRQDRLEHDARRISSAADRMHRLLAELLELSRVGRVVNPPEPVPLRELVQESLETLAGPIAERRPEVVVAADLPVLHGDRARLLEVVQNLLDNAVKYLGEQPAPRIEVGVRRRAGERPVCFVSDNGTGIDPAYQHKIFGLFERLDPEAAEGTGIGLALVKRIVEFHGGRIWVESEGLGRGSTFGFTLPPAHLPAPEPRSPPVPGSRSG